MKEFDIIEKYFSKLVVKEESLNLKDDCAVITSESQIIINVDSIVEGEHFFTQDPADSIAHKLLNVNLSDIAAMGATPKYWTMAITIPKNRLINEAWLRKFCHTLEKIQRQYNFYLISGDTTFTQAGKLTITANLFAEIPKTKTVLKKSTSQVGDIICVSGSIGDSYWGLQLRLAELKASRGLFNLSAEDKNYLIKRYLYPQARVNLGKILLNYATACTDVSDGLWADLEKMCKYSEVLGVVNVEDIPLSKAVKNLNSLNLSVEDKIINSITGGEDFELVFCINANKLPQLEEKLVMEGISIKKIGYIKKLKVKDKYTTFFKDGIEIQTLKKGYNY